MMLGKIENVPRQNTLVLSVFLSALLILVLVSFTVPVVAQQNTGSTVDTSSPVGITDSFSHDAVFRSLGESTVSQAATSPSIEISVSDSRNGNATAEVDIKISDSPTNTPSLSDYQDTTGATSTSQLRSALSDWRNGDIDTSLLRSVINNWRG